MKYTYESEIDYISAAIPELDSYVFSKELFWPLTSTSGKIQEKLTIGNLLLSIKRIEVFLDIEKRISHFLTLDKQLQSFKNEWLSNWKKKCHQENGARKRLWQYYLQDISQNKTFQSEYVYQVRHRVILDLLAAETDSSENLSALDRFLMKHSRKNEFIWGKQFTTIFPDTEFWYLYVNIDQV